MKSYIYIVITKELFRQSIVGQAWWGLAGCPSPLLLIPLEQDFCGIMSLSPAARS